ncbi:hypothetical protein SGM_6275 [Streptomyces griseoaurantiacus M045]|uniref:Uncharacterized protein n=1 Tax=Streptomyces griseoaurantiacus M045 TaxID=996637 RepID=F3NTH5_9ACTN|nr:hypothetical protein SGM_6275 [Streptomyces griseoaurantiacus M045]
MGPVDVDTPDDFCGLAFSAHDRRSGFPRRVLVPTSPSIVPHGCSRELRISQMIARPNRDSARRCGVTGLGPS